MGHETHHHGHHGSAGASARLVVSCLILFFTLSALGHYVFVVRTAHHGAPPRAAAMQKDHAAPADAHGGEAEKRPEGSTPHKKKH